LPLTAASALLTAKHIFSNYLPEHLENPDFMFFSKKDIFYVGISDAWHL